MAGEGAAGAVLGVGWKELTAPELIPVNSRVLHQHFSPNFHPFYPLPGKNLRLFSVFQIFRVCLGPLGGLGITLTILLPCHDFPKSK